jgi:Domain of unknown function (DUF1918)
MHAAIGDRIVIHGHRPGQVIRDCEVLDVHGAAGDPPYLVRWGDTGHEGLFFPGPDAVVEHLAPTTRRRSAHRTPGASSSAAG